MNHSLPRSVLETVMFMQFFAAHLPNPYTDLNMDRRLTDAMALVHRELEQAPTANLQDAFARAKTQNPARTADLDHMALEFFRFAYNPEKYQPLLSIDPLWKNHNPDIA